MSNEDEIQQARDRITIGFDNTDNRMQHLLFGFDEGVKACAAIKDAEIADLKEIADQHFMMGVETGKNEYREQLITAENEIASRDLIIKELREALVRIRQWDMLDACGDGNFWKGRLDEALTKTEHHDSRALDKRLLEAEIRGFSSAWGTADGDNEAHYIKLQAKLAELNKEK